MKFGQLIEYNVRDIFLKRSYTKCGGEARPKHFYKTIKTEHISGSTAWNDILFVFILCPSSALSKYIKTKVLTASFDLI